MTDTVYKAALIAALLALVAALLLFALGRADIAGPLLTAAFALAALGVRRSEKLGGISFSLLILAAVVLTLCYPAPFVSLGGRGSSRRAGERRLGRHRRPEERLDLLDRAGRALAGRALGHLDAAGRQRARADGEDPGHAEQLGIGELDAGRLVAVVPQDLAARHRRRGPWRRSAISTTRGSLAPPIDTRWAAYGATSAGQTMPFSSWWASTMQATFRPTPIPYEPMTIGWAWPSSPRYVAPNGVRERRPELEDVADLDARCGG